MRLQYSRLGSMSDPKLKACSVTWCARNICPLNGLIVPGLVVPPYWGNLVELYRQWSLVVDFARSLLGEGGGVSRIY
jgi:hypothetical protein